MYELENFTEVIPILIRECRQDLMKKIQKYVVLKNENKYYEKIKKFINIMLNGWNKKIRKIKKENSYNMMGILKMVSSRKK